MSVKLFFPIGTVLRDDWGKVKVIATGGSWVMLKRIGAESKNVKPFVRSVTQVNRLQLVKK